jgi:poly-gamma-glutamate synthase PgsB/CapB
MILLLVLLAILAYLVSERISHDRRVTQIPLRICVTGTRGKSSVTRMLASVLRSHGRSVLAKATGSQARLILPDGTETDIPRRDPASILEQKQLVKKAVELRADCLVSEIMSIQPETHRVEGNHLLKPHIVIVTNVRQDHTDVMGDTDEEIAYAFALTACPNTLVFLSSGIPREPFVRAASGDAERVRCISRENFASAAPSLGGREFEENLALVYSVARHLGIPDPTIADGILNTRHDAGRLNIWTYNPPENPCTYYLVNAFAANDPESTARVFSKVRALLPGRATNVVGVMNLRDDRIQRTLQWVAALKGPASAWFSRLYLTGSYPPAIRRRLPSAHFLENPAPEESMRAILSETSEDTIIFGFGNFAGVGKLLAEHWASIGVEYGI